MSEIRLHQPKRRGGETSDLIMPLTVDDLRRRWNWRPIRRCPGRYVLAESNPRISVEHLIGMACPVREWSSPAVHDPVLVIPLKDGGVISYSRLDGTILHTLNTAEGFTRKLSQLGIPIEHVLQP